CRSLREDTPLRLVASREIATVGGTFTSRCTCSGSPLNSASSVPKSARTSRMICSVQAGCRSGGHPVPGDEHQVGVQDEHAVPGDEHQVGAREEHAVPASADVLY